VPTTAPTSSPTAAPKPKTVPLITTNVTQREVTYGTRASTMFTIRVAGKPWAGKPVRMCVAEAGAEAACTDATTGITGPVVLTRAATAGFQVYVEVAETETTAAATSATSTWAVRANVAAQRSAKGAMTVTVLGAAGQTVQVQQQIGRIWVAVGEYTAEPMATVNGLTSGQRYRVVVPDTAAILGATNTPVIA
jgi:serine protease